MPTDPWLSATSWQRTRAYWRDQLAYRQLVCARCHRPILNNTGPWGLDVGHIISRDHARQLGWTIEQANNINNTQPEHRHCNRSAGATYRNNKHHNNNTNTTTIESTEW